MSYCSHHNKPVCSCGDQKKPVTILGGFLGSGKTTLMNNILTKSPDKKIEVVIREYGPIGIDNQLVKTENSHINLVSGVSMHQDPQLVLYGALENLNAQCHDHSVMNTTGGSKTFDYLLMESSGLDSPEHLSQLFFMHKLRDGYYLDSYITIVDAEYGDLTFDEYETAIEQIAFADIILINKIDLVDFKTVSNLESRIKSINSIAKVYKTEFAELYDLSKIININRFSYIPVSEEVNDMLNHKEVHQQKEKEDADMMNEVKTIVLSESRPLVKEEVNKWIKDLFTARGDKILRSKGFLNFTDDDHRYVFQAVRKTFHSKADRLWETNEKRESVIVLIGKDLGDSEELQEAFSSCAANGKP